MSPEFDTSPFEAAMWAEAEALEHTRREIDRLQEQLKVQRGTVTDAIRRYGAALQIAELPVPRSTIRSLYWEHRDIFVESIASGFNIEGGAGQVHLYAGDSHFDAECPGGCGQKVHLYAGDSHFDAECPGGCGQKVRLSARSSPLRPCEECASTLAATRAAEHEAWRANADARIADRDAWVRDQLAEGRTAEDLYVDLHGRFDASGALEHLRALAAEVAGERLSEF